VPEAPGDSAAVQWLRPPSVAAMSTAGIDATKRWPALLTASTRVRRSTRSPGNADGEWADAWPAAGPPNLGAALPR